jgi:hypothetical protein
MALQIRRGTTLDRAGDGTPEHPGVRFKEGEIVFDTTIKQVFIGDGTTLGGRPVTAYTDEDAITAIGDALVAGTHQNISFSYDTTGTDRINATVTLDGRGIEEVGDDISPELGGNLNLNTHDITGTGNINITGSITATSYNGVTAADVGLGNVTNESKATMFTDPIFTNPTLTGTISGITATAVGLGNVANESKATMFTDPTFTGTTTTGVLDADNLVSITVEDADGGSVRLLVLDLITESTSGSGPCIEFNNNSTMLGRLLISDTEEGPLFTSVLYDADTNSYVNSFQAAFNYVMLNDGAMSIANNGIFTFDLSKTTPTITGGTDLTLYPDGNIITYGNLIPGQEGWDQNLDTAVSIPSGTFDIGSNSARYKDLYLAGTVAVGTNVTFPDNTVQTTAYAGGQGHMMMIDTNRTDTYVELGTADRPFKTFAAAIAAAEAATATAFTFVLMGCTVDEDVDFTGTTFTQITISTACRSVITGDITIASIPTLSQLFVRNIEIGGTFTLTGDGTSEQMNSCNFYNVTFSGPVNITATNATAFYEAAFFDNVNFTNLSYLYINGAQFNDDLTITADDTSTYPIPSRGINPGTGGSVSIVFGTIANNVYFVKGGTAAYVFQPHMTRLGRTTESYTIPSGWTVSAYGADFRGTWTNNGAMGLKISGTDNRVLGTAPSYSSIIGGDRVIADLAPASSKGVAGDRASMMAVAGGYLYVCTADYTTGVADIWTRTPLTTGAW